MTSSACTSWSRRALFSIDESTSAKFQPFSPDLQFRMTEHQAPFSCLTELIWQTEVLILWLQPTALSEARRRRAFEFVKDAIQQRTCIASSCFFLTGCVDVSLFVRYTPVRMLLCPGSLHPTKTPPHLLVHDVTQVISNQNIFTRFGRGYHALPAPHNVCA